jgi:Fic family protein
MSRTPVVRVPPVEYETGEWRPRHPEMYSRAECARQTGEYRSAVPARIAGWQPMLTGGIAADIDDASLALKEFDEYARMQLGRGSELVPMSAILLRTESASSSRIEQLTTSARQLALAELGEGGKRNAAAVVGNVRAMEAALRLSESMDAAGILLMHRELMERQPGWEGERGAFRSGLVWVGGADSAGPRGAEYVAPQHTRVEPAIADLTRFMARTDLPGLVHTAVAHAQFETIHPFSDGNGRTGRALVHALLRSTGVVTRWTVPLSAGLLRRVEEYFSALSDYRAGDAGPLLRAFANAARFSAVRGIELVDALAEQLEFSRGRLEGLRPQAVAWSVLPLLLGRPVVNSRYLVEALGVSQVTVQRALGILVERGVLSESSGRGRNRLWQHRGILDVLDGFAAGLRRTDL